MIVIEEEVTVEQIDECLSHVYAMLKTDEYGNRMNWRKKEMLAEQLDELLDARNNLVKTGKP
ncbi:MAG: hypothetical protein EBU33_08360 [Sphingobacteriia bacterium]|nr:hypothetical protein [Sphingobacteriia bacterium]